MNPFGDKLDALYEGREQDEGPETAPPTDEEMEAMYRAAHPWTATPLGSETHREVSGESLVDSTTFRFDSDEERRILTAVWEDAVLVNADGFPLDEAEAEPFWAAIAEWEATNA